MSKALSTERFPGGVRVTFADGAVLTVRKTRGLPTIDLAEAGRDGLLRLEMSSRQTRAVLEQTEEAAAAAAEDLRKRVHASIRPTHICGKPLRGGVVCGLAYGHRRKKHTSATYTCDGCGEPRIEPPHSSHPEAGWFCFMCVGPPAKGAY